MAGGADLDLERDHLGVVLLNVRDNLHLHLKTAFVLFLGLWLLDA